MTIWLLRGQANDQGHEQSSATGIVDKGPQPVRYPRKPKQASSIGNGDMMKIAQLGIPTLGALLLMGGHAGAIEMPVATQPVDTVLHDSKVTPVSDLLFTHQVHRPEHPSGQTIVLLHGSGGDETSLLPLASKIAPNATFLAARGRIVQEGVQRWYRRITPVEFDQEDIRAEADAFAEFLSGAAHTYGLDLSGAIFLGYSNGANLIAAMTLLHPQLVQRAVLLRPMCALNETPATDLADIRFLTVVGKADKLYAPLASKLEQVLRGRGAQVDARVIRSGHELGDEDIRVVSEWLSTSNMLEAKLPSLQ